MDKKSKSLVFLADFANIRHLIFIVNLFTLFIYNLRVKNCLFKPKVPDVCTFRPVFQYLLFGLCVFVLSYVSFRSACLKVGEGYSRR